MDAAGGQELRMSVLQPRELWQESGRDEDYGEGMFRLRDRREREMVLAPTHEELLTTMVKANVNSYRDLPLILLPDTDEVPRRAPAQGRPAASPRVRHEGRVQLRHRAGRARCQLRLDGEGVQEHLREMRPGRHHGRGRQRHHWRPGLAGVHPGGGLGRGHRDDLRRVRLRGERGEGRPGQASAGSRRSRSRSRASIRPAFAPSTTWPNSWTCTPARP